MPSNSYLHFVIFFLCQLSLIVMVLIGVGSITQFRCAPESAGANVSGFSYVEELAG